MVPEGGSAAMYLLFAALSCLAAILFRRRGQAAAARIQYCLNAEGPPPLNFFCFFPAKSFRTYSYIGLELTGD